MGIAALVSSWRRRKQRTQGGQVLVREGDGTLRRVDGREEVVIITRTRGIGFDLLGFPHEVEKIDVTVQPIHRTPET